MARSFFPVLLLVLVVRTFVFEPFRIPSKSMVPTLLVGDFVLAEKFAYGLRLPVTHTKILSTGEPQRGDVMLFRYPENPAANYIKRVVGLPGDTVTYKNDQLYVNGKKVARTKKGTYRGPNASVRRPMTLFSEKLPGSTNPHPILHIVTRGGLNQKTVTVPEGKYFVMGDNRDNSDDSRDWGFVPAHNLVGRATMIWFSINWQNFNVRWSRIGDWLS
ncbi:signal peptidase I [Salinisphaera sp. USBA-960]|nr:signal peptidase I [Salifodinibacter halophilus]NNC26078.1 signal peptidase I [Salifodinibacter halophilus]